MNLQYALIGRGQAKNTPLARHQALSRRPGTKAVTVGQSQSVKNYSAIMM